MEFFLNLFVILSISLTFTKIFEFEHSVELDVFVDLLYQRMKEFSEKVWWMRYRSSFHFNFYLFVDAYCLVVLMQCPLSS